MIAIAYGITNLLKDYVNNLPNMLPMVNAKDIVIFYVVTNPITASN